MRWGRAWKRGAAIVSSPYRRQCSTGGRGSASPSVDLRYAPLVDRDVTGRAPDTMTVTERLIDGVVVLMVVGRMTVETGESALTRLVKARLGDGSRAFVVNLGEVPSCDTRGLAELILSLTMVERKEGALKLAQVQPRVMTLLETTGLLGVFEMFDTEREALASFRSLSKSI